MTSSATQIENRPTGIEAIHVHQENIHHPSRDNVVRTPATVLSAKLVAAGGPDGQKEALQTEADRLEAQLKDTVELDDPLEPYLLYIKWILKTFPNGQATETGLVQLLERCTSEFRDSPYYKDDPRYLGVWMRYIQYSDAPRDIFFYLAKKEIGRNLATYYEEYASHLENQNCRRQAKEVFETGISLQARPFERLKRKYQAFIDRISQNPPDPNEPASAPLPPPPQPRTALSVKREDGSIPQKLQVLQEGPSSSGWGSEASGSQIARPQKLAIFKDSVCDLRLHSCFFFFFFRTNIIGSDKLAVKTTNNCIQQTTRKDSHRPGTHAR